MKWGPETELLKKSTSERGLGCIPSNNGRKYKENVYLLELKGGNIFIAEIESQAWAIHHQRVFILHCPWLWNAKLRNQFEY